MKFTSYFLIGCAVFATAAGCATEGANDESEQTQGSELEANKLAPATSQFLQIRVSNTNLCLWPSGGSSGNVQLGLHTCNRAQTVQNWVRVPSGGGNELVNQATGKCIYYNGSAPIPDHSQLIIQADCNVFGSTAIASNAIWRLDAATGNTVFESKLGNKDTNVCIDVPNANDGQLVQMFHCTRQPEQIFILE